MNATVAGRWFNYRPATLAADMRRSLKLGMPLIGAQLLSMGNGLVDALVAGRLGEVQLAAGGIGAGLWFFASLVCIGMMGGLSPVLSRLIGERRQRDVGGVFRQGLMLGVAVGLGAIVFLLVLNRLLPLFGMDQALLPFIREYLRVALWSLPFVAIVMATRNLCEATGVVRPVLIVQALGLAVNTVADLLFGLGMFGMPRLGLTGIGVATTTVNVVMAIALLQYLRQPRFAVYRLFASFEPPDLSRVRSIARLALPITLAIMFEAGLFVSATVLMGRLGTQEAAAHYIAAGFASICFMLPLGLSFALTSRIGRADGRDQPRSVRLRVHSGLLIMFLMALVTATLLVLFRHSIVRLYTDDHELQSFAAGLLLMAALFQLSDCLQVALLGMLRGLHDTLVPMLINGFSYWVIAFGIGYYAAFHGGMGAYGIWMGLIIGLSVAAILLALRLRWVLARR